MTENENIEVDEREVSDKRGKSVLIGRFLAVGLFVALGTFAVIQSISGDKDNHDHDHEQDLVESSTGDDEPSDKDNRVTPLTETPAVKSKLALGSNAANTTPAISKAETFSKTFKPPVVATPKQTGGTFGNTSLGQNAPKTPPAKTPPPNRIAQLDNGSARSTFGIGGPATPPANNPVVKPLGGGTLDGLREKVNAATNSAASRFNQLGSDIKNTANDATSRAKSAFGNPPAANTGSSTRSRFDSGTTQPKKPDVVSSGSPFSQQRESIKPIEAKSSLDSVSGRPFGTNQPKTGTFESRSLNPISRSSTQQTRTPSATTAAPAPIRNMQSRTGTPAPLPRDPFSQSGTNRTTTPPPQRNPIAATTGRSSSFPPPRSTSATQATQTQPRRTSLPTTTSRAPVMQASRVSAKPGDRQFEGVQSPSMIIQKFSPREIQVNQTADFEIKIRNVGRIAVEDVLVVDQVPEGARFVDANPKPTSQTRIGELQWQLGVMKPGEERTILLQLQPTEPGEIGSVAQFYFGGRASNRTKVTQPKLKITHTSDPKILIGNNVVFDVIVENTGNGPAKDVVIQEEVPELLEYQDGSRELEYEIGTLQPGQSKRIQLGLRAARVGNLRNIMFASAKGGLQAKHETDVEIIAPKLETSCDGPTARFIKRQVAHTFTVANKGTASATNLRLIARLPSGLRFVSANNRGRYDKNSHSVVWQMRDLSAGGSGDVEVVTTPIEAGEQNIKFEAAADLNQASETVQKLNVEHLVDVFFDIDDVIDPIEIGGTTRYRIRLISQGTQAASNVQLQIDFPQGLQPTSVDGDLRNEIRGQQIVFEQITSLRQGEELNVTVEALGKADGDHRVVVNMQAGGRTTPVSKQETTRVYRDR